MKNILLVVDMQKGFARCEQTLDLRDKILKLLELKVFDSIVATRFLNDNDSIYEKLLKWKKLKTEDERAIDSSYNQYIDFVFDKYIYNCVNSSFIQKLCQLNDGKYPERIFKNNIRPIVLTNYCSSNGGNLSHEAGILCMKRLIGKNQLVDIEINKSTDLLNI